MADGKPFSTWLSGELLKKAAERAGDTAGGNESRYVRSLIERDVATNPSTILVELAKQYQPAMAEKIAHALVQIEAVTGKPVDGRVVMARLLDAYATALQDPDFKPEQSFKLVDTSQYHEWENVSDDRMQNLAMRLAEIQKKYPSSLDNNPKPSAKSKPSPMDGKLAEMSRKASRVL